jgi:hypothetical protein
VVGLQQWRPNVSFPPDAVWQKTSAPDRTGPFFNTQRGGHRWIYSVFRASPDLWLLPPERDTPRVFSKLIHQAATSGLNH